MPGILFLETGSAPWNLGPAISGQGSDRMRTVPSALCGGGTVCIPQTIWRTGQKLTFEDILYVAAGKNTCKSILWGEGGKEGLFFVSTIQWQPSIRPTAWSPQTAANLGERADLPEHLRQPPLGMPGKAPLACGHLSRATQLYRTRGRERFCRLDQRYNPPAKRRGGEDYRTALDQRVADTGDWVRGGAYIVSSAL